MEREDRSIYVALSIWILIAIVFARARWFGHASAPVVALTVWILTALVLLAWWKLPAVRAWADDLPLPALIGLHLTRFVGFYFLFLCKDGAMPEAFALPAGIGDIVVAIGAVVLLVIPQLRQSRPIVLAWNALGFMDIVFVVFSALRLGLHDWGSMAPLRELPLSLLPTFLVPLIMTSHVLIFVRMRKRQEKVASRGTLN